MRPVNCPNCNSKQLFAPKKRNVNGKIQTYIRCRTCREEIIVSEKTQDQLRAERRRNQTLRRGSIRRTAS